MALKDQLKEAPKGDLNPKQELLKLLKNKWVVRTLIFLALYLIFCLLRLLTMSLIQDVQSIINLFN